MNYALVIRVTRTHLFDDCTIGKIEIDLPGDGAGFLPFGYCMEDRDRAVEEDLRRKIRGQTAIPIGTYKVKLYDSPKHGAETPELIDVPGYQHVQIHSGNTAEHTEGCLLPGLDQDLVGRKVLRSRLASDWLCGEIRKTIKAGGAVTVEVRRAG
jgi:hypothetical protein